MNRRFSGLLHTVPGLVLGAVGASNCGTSLENQPPVDGPGPCDFACPMDGVASGNASISTVPSLDGFFGSLVRFSAAANDVSAGIRAELDAMAASLGAKAGDTADLKAKLDAKLAENVSGGLTVTFQPVRCRVSTKAVLDAQIACAGETPPFGSATCDGSCSVPTETSSCGASATLSCTGAAPGSSCSGTCKGECTLETPGKCDGICQGTCTGNCSIKNGMGDCAGSCDGTCKGRCRLDAAAQCDGACKGECTYPSPDGACDATAQAHCDASADVPVSCDGSCSGNLVPAKVNGACDQRARVDASVSARCTPPALNVSYQLLPSVAADPAASGAFQAWFEGFRGHVAVIVAYAAKVRTLGSAAADMARDAPTAIDATIRASLPGETRVVKVFGMGCAITELPLAISTIKKAATDLEAAGRAALDVLSSIGVS